MQLQLVKKSFYFMLILFNPISLSHTFDDYGYILYCPCMGRFGNQADQFLGALAFSKALNRTLVLAPWVEYQIGASKSIQVPFDTYFNVNAIQIYHKAVTMEYFMHNTAKEVWPEEKRISFCYIERAGRENNTCNAKDGNPFGPFWDTFNIDFVYSKFYSPLHYDVHNGKNIQNWLEKFPSKEYPVLAFTGAPASFPVQDENRHLQKYMRWSDSMESKAKSFIKMNLSGGAYIGLHLRNGGDWRRACEHVAESALLFAAPQCVGYRGERGPLTHAMCLPTKHDIIKQVKRTLKLVNDVKWVYVSSDSDYMVEELSTAVGSSGVLVARQPAPAASSSPHLDLAVLARANYFIGNCVSSFSAFVKRERDVLGLPSAFWAYPSRKKNRREEL